MNRLATRLSLSFSALSLLTVLVILGGTSLLGSRWAGVALDSHMVSVAEAAVARLETGESPGAVVDRVASAAQFVEIRDAAGDIIASADVLDGRVIPAAPVSSDPTGPRFEVAEMTRSRVRILTVPIDADGMVGYVVVASPMPEGGLSLAIVVGAAATAGAIGLLVAIGGGWVISRWVSQPLSALASEVERAQRSGLRHDVETPASGSVEVQHLGAAIRELIEAQREAVRRERAFFSDSSHVLRTPLAVLRGNLDLLSEGDPPEEMREGLEQAAAAVDAMSRTVTGLLLLSRNEAGDPEDWQIVSLSALVESLVNDTRTLAPSVTLTSTIAPDVEVWGDPHQLRELLVAVLENAARYTPAGQRIDVSVLSKSDRAVVEVRDTGIGLSQQEADRAPERFFRGYRARQLFPGGTGLGLSIASRIAELHGGDLRLTPSDVGVVARIDLPCALAAMQ